MSCPIYIINLKRNPERRLYMQRQLDAFGLDYRFVEVDFFDKYELESKAYRIRVAQMLGIEEQALENKYAAVINSVKNKPNRKYNQLAILAVGLSHLKVYSLMIKNNHEMACILEDDAKLSPTFPDVLKAVPDLKWDILQFCHQPKNISAYTCYKTQSPDLTILRRLFRKNHNELDEQLIRKYGFDSQGYTKPAAYVTKTIQLYRKRYKSIYWSLIPEIILSVFIPNIIRNFLVSESHLSYKYEEAKRSNHLLNINTIIELGVFPEKPNPDLITEHHCIAEPRERIVSTTAYLVRQSAITKWKQELLSENTLAVDEIPWRLYEDGQVKLCIISPPCVTAAYHYLKYTVRRPDYHLKIKKPRFNL